MSKQFKISFQNYSVSALITNEYMNEDPIIIIMHMDDIDMEMKYWIRLERRSRDLEMEGVSKDSVWGDVT